MAEPRATEETATTRTVDPAVRGVTLVEQIKDRLLTWIVEGHLPPGSRVIETRIAQELGISQGPVREAIRDLAELGMVEIQPYRGARVRRPTLEEHVEAIEVCTELEALAAREVAGKLTDAQLAQLAGLADEMSRLAEMGTVHDVALRNTEFYVILMQASGNGALRRIWTMVQPFAQAHFTLTMADSAATADRVDRHLPILEALRQGNADGAAAAVREHGTANAALITEVRAQESDGPGEDSAATRDPGRSS